MKRNADIGLFTKPSKNGYAIWTTMVCRRGNNFNPKVMRVMIKKKASTAPQRKKAHIADQPIPVHLPAWRRMIMTLDNAERYLLFLPLFEN